jgi:hypothetical protein
VVSLVMCILRILCYIFVHYDHERTAFSGQTAPTNKNDYINSNPLHATYRPRYFKVVNISETGIKAELFRRKASSHVNLHQDLCLITIQASHHGKSNTTYTFAESTISRGRRSLYCLTADTRLLRTQPPPSKLRGSCPSYRYRASRFGGRFSSNVSPQSSKRRFVTKI